MRKQLELASASYISTNSGMRVDMGALHSGGQLFYQWSQKANTWPGKETAFAFFKPTKKVPNFKYTSKGGKSEIIRGAQVPTYLTSTSVCRAPQIMPSHWPQCSATAIHKAPTQCTHT